jgi:sortase A
MKNKRKKASVFLIISGLLLIAAAVFWLCFNLIDENRASEESARILESLRENISGYQEENIWENGGNPSENAEAESQDTAGGETEIPDYILNPDMEMPTVVIDGAEYIGTLDVPELNLSLPVMSKWSESGLKVSPCRYSGSVYSKDLVIGGHSYISHFRPLRDISLNSDIIFTDADGNVFYYKVTETEVLQPSDIDILLEEDHDLTLFTCTSDTQARFIVRCKLE